MSINKVILVGRLGQDPELKYTPAGAAVCNFTVATSEQWTDKSGQKQERTEWHRIVVWAKLAELCKEYIAKGSQVYLEGKLATRSWEDKEGNKRYTTEILAQTVQFLGSASNNQGRTAAQKPNQNQQGGNYYQNNTPSQDQGYQAPPADQNFTADDIPF